MVLCEKLLPLLFLLVFINISPCMSSSCPWLAPNLVRWSDPLTWGNQGVPRDGDTVVVNQAILLDTETTRLNTLILRDGGSLIFSPDVELSKLTVGVVKIQENGSFLIGGPECRFQGSVMRVGSDTFGDPIFQNGLQN